MPKESAAREHSEDQVLYFRARREHLTRAASTLA